MDIDAIAKTMRFAEGKSKAATIDFLNLIIARADVVGEIEEAIQKQKTDAELVTLMRRPFLAFNNNLRSKLPRAKSQAQWRGMFGGVMSIVDWDLLARTIRLVYESEDEA